MAQERMDSSSSVNTQSSFDAAPDIGPTLARVRDTMNKVRVIHGANEGYYDLHGKTVGSIRKSLRDVFNISAESNALVGGKDVSDDFIVETGMNLEFVKEAGVKGWDTIKPV